MHLSVNRKIQICIISNFILLLGITTLISIFADKNVLRYGYSKDLVVIGVTIDSLEKYLILQSIIFMVEFFHSIIFEYANPIMYFNVFNDQKKYITDFTKFELQFYAQTLWFITSIKNGLMLLVSITQIDITMCKILYSEIAVMIVIRALLNNKKFMKNNIADPDDEALLHQICIE